MKQINDFTRGKLLYVTVSGSKLYGTADELSDTDYKGIYHPNIDDIVTGNAKDSIDMSSNKSSSKNSSDDIDMEIHSLSKWLALLRKGETGALDLLFSIFNKDTTVMIDSEFKKIISAEFKTMLTRNPRAFVGYANQQASKFAIKGARYTELSDFNNKFSYWTTTKSLDTLEYDWTSLKELVENQNYRYIKFVVAPGPRKTDDIEYLEVLGRRFAPHVTTEHLSERLSSMEESYGHRAKGCDTDVEWKSLSHAIRVVDEVSELLATGFITFPLKNRKFIYNVKRGNVPLNDVKDYLETAMLKVDDLVDKSDLPSKLDKRITDKLLLKIHNLY